MVAVDRDLFACFHDCCDRQANESRDRRAFMHSVWRHAGRRIASGYMALYRVHSSFSYGYWAGRGILWNLVQGDGDCACHAACRTDLQRLGGAINCRTGRNVRTAGDVKHGRTTFHRFDTHDNWHFTLKRRILAALICVFLIIPFTAEAESIGDELDRIMSSIDFSGLEDITLTLSQEKQDVSVMETVKLLASGEGISPFDVLTNVFQTFARQVSRLGSLAVSIVIPVILSSLVTAFSTTGKAPDKLGKNLGLLVVLVPVILAVISELEYVGEAITDTTEKMNRILPLLLTLLTAVGGSASSVFLHPVVVAASGSMVYLAREVVLRLVMCTCAVTTVNHLSDRAHLSRLARLLKSAVCWLLGVSFTIFLGTMSIQGICSASFDGVAIRAAKYAIDNFVPIVGGMFADTMDTLVGCTLIVKNALGVTAMLILGGVMMLPIVRAFSVAAVMKICAALLEPVAQKETVDAIEDFSGLIVLFLVTMLCVFTMYFLLIVQILLVGNLTVMLR